MKAMRQEIATAALVASEVFAARHWQYGRGDAAHVPDAEDICLMLTHLVTSVDEGDTGYCASGRFVAERYWGGTRILLELADWNDDA